jgi:hypothetical protein
MIQNSDTKWTYQVSLNGTYRGKCHLKPNNSCIKQISIFSHQILVQAIPARKVIDIITKCNIQFIS